MVPQYWIAVLIAAVIGLATTVRTADAAECWFQEPKRQTRACTGKGVFVVQFTHAVNASGWIDWGDKTPVQFFAVNATTLTSASHGEDVSSSSSQQRAADATASTSSKHLPAELYLRLDDLDLYLLQIEHAYSRTGWYSMSYNITMVGRNYDDVNNNTEEENVDDAADRFCVMNIQSEAADMYAEKCRGSTASSTAWSPFLAAFLFLSMAAIHMA